MLAGPVGPLRTSEASAHCPALYSAVPQEGARESYSRVYSYNSIAIANGIGYMMGCSRYSYIQQMFVGYSYRGRPDEKENDGMLGQKKLMEDGF